ncbi:RrF2 family transcriptional regulator [Amedibacillus sp. YH-ame10]
MKLSTKSRYAVRSMIDLAAANQTLSIMEIGQNQNISERYLELIFAKLKKSGLLKSVRGSHGGYQLSRSADEITIYDIVHTMETNSSIVKVKESNDPLKCVLQREIWNPIDHNLEEYLKSIKLSSLL